MVGGATLSGASVGRPAASNLASSEINYKIPRLVVSGPMMTLLVVCLMWCCAIPTSIVVGSQAVTNNNQHHQPMVLASNNINYNGTQRATTKARVSLESKAFDLDDETDEGIKELMQDKSTYQPQNELKDASGTNVSQPPKLIANATGSKKRKSGRRFSDIWSMFLPGSQEGNVENENDNLDEVENVDDGSSPDADSISSNEHDRESAVKRVAADATTQANYSTARYNNRRTNVAQSNDDRHQSKELRPVNKLPAPVNIEASRHQQNELLEMSGSSGQQALATKKPLSGQSKTNATAEDQDDMQPVRLITGALSNNSSDFASRGNLLPPNMNEIVSNIMGSLGTSSSRPVIAASVDSNLSPSNETEPEQELPSSASGTTSNGSQENANFERWLSKIMGSDTRSPNSGLEREQPRPTSSGGGARGVQAAANSDPKGDRRQLASDSSSGANGKDKVETNNSDNGLKWSSSPISARRVGSNSSNVELGDGRLPIQSAHQSAGGVKGHPKRATQPSHRTQQQQAVLDVGGRLKYQSHPFQEQIRQQQAQLIHGIKYPHGQASTISVSTVDGASNTSLAFGAHYIPQINPPNAGGNQETSQVVNSTQAPHNHSAATHSSGTSANTTNADLSVNTGLSDTSGYQSQDEILRQVTSAINFEQQQLMSQQRRSNGQQQQQQQQVEIVSQQGDNDENDMYMTPDGASRLQKSGSSQTNKTIPNDGGGSGSSIESILKAIGNFNAPPGSGQNQSQNTVSSGDIDKSFELLAEKVRQLASQQQQLQQLQQQQSNQFNLLGGGASLNRNESQQPSWLRAQQALASLNNGERLAELMKQSGNLTNLAGAIGKQNQGQQQQLSLEQVRDLLQKHETTKDELKRSQESMLTLMRQIMQLKMGADPARQANASSSPPDLPSHQRQQLSGNDELYQLNQMSNLLGNNDEALPGGGQQSPATNVSNLGWAPLMATDRQIQLQQASRGRTSGNKLPNDNTFAPQSPANLMKNKVRFPNQHLQQHHHHHHHHHQNQHHHQDQHQPNNIGLVLNPQHISLEQTNDLDQQIVGLPIALLNNEEIELSHHQLEEAARIAAEQLGVIPSSGSNLSKHPDGLQSLAHNSVRPQIQHHNGQKFVQRAEGSQNVHPMAPNRLHPANEHLSHVQKLLQTHSPQTFEQLMMNKPMIHAKQTLQKSASNDQRRPGGELQQQHNLGQLEKLASLLPPLEQDTGAQPERSNDDKGTEPAGESGTNQAAGEEPAARGALKKKESKVPSQRNEAFRLSQGQTSISNSSQSQQQAQQRRQQQQQQQQQQQRQQVVVSQLGPRQANVLPVGQYGQIPRPASESLLQSFRPLLDSNHYLPPPARQLYDDSPPPPPPGYTTFESAGGPPMKMHELTLRRPFGFRGHHSISYQASPVMAEMFPRLLARPPPSPLAAAASRPGLLRHMTPIRATINEGQKIISQMLPAHLADHLGRYHYHQQYPTHNSLGQTLPIPPLRQYSLLPAGPNQIRRAAHLGNKQQRQQRLHDWSLLNTETTTAVKGNREKPAASSGGRMVQVGLIKPADDEFEFSNDQFDGQLDQTALDQLVRNSEQLNGDSQAGIEQLHLLQVPNDDLRVDQHLVDRPRSRPGRQKQQVYQKKGSEATQFSGREREGNGGHTMSPARELHIDRPSSLAAIKQLSCINATTTPRTPDSTNETTKEIVSTMRPPSSILHPTTTTLAANITETTVTPLTLDSGTQNPMNATIANSTVTTTA
jgi:hypothetical protein